jgi:hypothetical protein
MRILIGILLFYLLLSGCAKPLAAEYRGIQNISIQNIQGDSAQLSLEVSMFNPNKFDIKVWSMEADCLLANKLVGNVNLDTLIVIPASRETAIPVVASIGLSQLISNGISFLLGADLIYSVRGKVKAGKGGIKWNIPFTQTGKLDKSAVQKLFR